jgi:hypothetical protein
MRYILTAIALATCLAFGCSSNNANGDGDVGDLDSESACEERACDAVYTGPTVDFEVSTSDGESYCGPVTVTHHTGYGFTDEGVTTMECDCVGGELRRSDGSGSPDAGSSGGGCDFDAPWGLTTPVTIEAPGYETVETSVSPPCECHAKTTLSVTLEPI